MTRIVCEEIINRLKSEGREKEVQRELKTTKAGISKELAYLKGQAFDEYAHDMSIAKKYADLNRKAIAEIIIREMGFRTEGGFTTIHNYIDFNEMILPERGHFRQERRGRNHLDQHEGWRHHRHREGQRRLELVRPS